MISIHVDQRVTTNVEDYGWTTCLIKHSNPQPEPVNEYKQNKKIK